MLLACVCVCACLPMLYLGRLCLLPTDERRERRGRCVCVCVWYTSRWWWWSSSLCHASESAAGDVIAAWQQHRRVCVCVCVCVCACFAGYVCCPEDRCFIQPGGTLPV